MEKISNHILEKNNKKNINQFSKTKKVFIFTTIIIILLVIFGVRVTYVNGQYPSIENESYSLGESFEWDDFTITVTGYEVLNAEQIKEKWPDINTNSIADYDIIIADIAATYHGEKDSARFPITSIRGQSGAWYNSSELEAVTTFNQGSATCKNGEMRTLYTAIGISYLQFSGMDTKNYLDRNIDLVFQTYPEIIKVKLY